MQVKATRLYCFATSRRTCWFDNCILSFWHLELKRVTLSRWLAQWANRDGMTRVIEAETDAPSRQVVEALGLIANWRQDLEQSVSRLESEIARLRDEARQRSAL